MQTKTIYDLNIAALGAGLKSSRTASTSYLHLHCLCKLPEWNLFLYLQQLFNSVVCLLQVLSSQPLIRFNGKQGVRPFSLPPSHLSQQFWIHWCTLSTLLDLKARLSVTPEEPVFSLSLLCYWQQDLVHVALAFRYTKHPVGPSQCLVHV